MIGGGAEEGVLFSFKYLNNIHYAAKVQRTRYRPLLRTAPGAAYSHTTQLLDGAERFEPSLGAN